MGGEKAALAGHELIRLVPRDKTYKKKRRIRAARGGQRMPAFAFVCEAKRP